ncbi:1-acyl-sn-glycerol-3-phosphate acyltransferase [Primorskyibacter aestuariivivens]|uniref:1-acyl-sn-glycerol-3-phosphate acyltransferase n=1 Tax=Primorskyibacter aestuariivivens TaxID=1888912 RepID=UPI002301C597|nr:1-acyl-sn-glycerol-3-phosphate acyltransferase [Primorskyibacter aestuariivivens]MDA7427277.1 1-acyl-sn-glycerol-3-phosphate acyltransferase [Primorskyibacter aestuariivivens]
MTERIEIPIWLFVLILAFAAVTFASHFLFPSVRWFLRRRMERVVARLNTRLARPIQPFKLARRTDMIQRLVYDPAVTEAIVDHAREHGLREDVAFEQAKRYAREIVPSFSATAYFGFAIRAARLLARFLYHVRLGRYDKETLDNVDPDATLIFVINHRSNMDYVLVTYLAASQSALSYAVGEWARVWPLSRLIRAMGAYFIRRKDAGPLYRRVLARYVAMATQGGVAQAMFPEGGLSLDGALAPPRMGLLKYITDGWQPDGRDVVFVPVALNYDRVLEDRVLLDAHRSGTRRFRARIGEALRFGLSYLLRRATGRVQKFGYAAVSFGTPLSLNAHVAAHGADPEPLALELMERIGAVVPVLPVPLLSLVLRDGVARDRDALREAVDAELGCLALPPEHAVHCAPDEVVAAGLDVLLRRSLVQETPEGQIRVDPAHIDVLAYYANSISHLERRNSATA